MNGEEYNLQVLYDFTLEEWGILGATQGIDDKGMADKEMRLPAFFRSVRFSCAARLKADENKRTIELINLYAPGRARRSLTKGRTKP